MSEKNSSWRKNFSCISLPFIAWWLGKKSSWCDKKCFDKIPANGEPIATIAIGTGFIGMISGANFRQIICGMHDSKQKIMLHAGYTLDAVIDWYNEEKQKQNLEKEKNYYLNYIKKVYFKE